MTFEEVYQQIRKMHYEILDERESISKSARLSLSTWMLDILTEYRMATEGLEREPSDDLISRAEAIEAIEIVDWYHQNSNKDMVSGANSDEHQAWYKAQDIYKALEAVPSADRQMVIKCKPFLSEEDFKAFAEQASDQNVILISNEAEVVSTNTSTNTSTKSTNISTDTSADRPRGYWIGDKCSVCGEERAWYGSNPPVCPDCGAKMEHNHDYERASDMRDYCERYEPTYNSEDGSMQKDGGGA